MLGRLVVVAATLALASCAGLEPAGRNANRGPTAAPPPPAASTTTAPARTAPALPPPQATAPTPTNRPLVTAPPASTTAPAVVARPTPAPTPAPSATAPTVAAPQVAAPPPAQASTTSRDTDDAIVVPGQRDVQVQPPAGDPRSTAQRMEDVRAWDRCVTQVQSAFEGDPMRPQLTTPEEYCRQSLGMASRLAVPESRRQRQR